MLLRMGLLIGMVLGMPSGLWAADPPPSVASTVGQLVTNPETGLSTTVSALLTDPAGTPTAGNTAFVRTADGYVFLVKAVNEIVYNADTPPLGFKIISQDTMAKTVVLQAQTTPASTETATLGYQILYTDLQAQLLGSDTAGITPPAVMVDALDGVQVVNFGDSGSNGRNGALFVRPNSGGDGDAGPAASYTTSFNISTTNKVGLEVGSLGGYGGKGGNSYGSFWKGRSGGDGGAGGLVSVLNDTGFQIATTGEDMHGIFAYSRSGKAGDGGSGYAATGGGAGGHSNNGGDVTVENRGTIITTGKGAFGIYALSVSNNGGNGGDTWGLVGQSGSGSYGGNGGIVTITNTSTGAIYTSGEYAHGIFAQSVGGSGGSSGTSGNLLVALSGQPDDGGKGGDVSVLNFGLISTTGDNARGIFAQSIGGGGGSGGTAGGLISLGGSGSAGGSSGSVVVKNQDTGRITTLGLKSDGIFAQSVGGSGGSGSNSYGLVAVGGSGSVAGNGGTVTVENEGLISTAGDAARGIVAQSIGGGGGDGGSSGGMVSVGGSGDGGGFGDKVTVKNSGSITTAGAGSTGIFAQSVGGGGGNGGSSGSVGLFGGVGIGGDGGKGGTGGNVEVTLQGKDAITASVISTEGDRSTGIFAQSVGGGGGNGGGAVTTSLGFDVASSVAIGGKGGVAGDGGLVTLSKGTGISIIETDGQDSTAVFLQSVGGGGGNGGYAISVAASGGPAAGSMSMSIGGAGGAGGAGGDVTVGAFDSSGALTSTGFNGTILTSGDRSTGLLAQSVGGGGGNGGLAVAASGSVGATLSGSASVSLGGAGAGGGTGGTVQVGTQGNITTEGMGSTGLFVQSVGGGGGNGGGSIAASIAGGGGAGSFGIAIGGDAGTASNGGDVNVVTRSGTITTKGADSLGILIQSVGGGGGNGGYAISAGAAGGVGGAAAVNVAMGGKGGGGGNGGNVKADLQSNVETSSVVIARALDPVTGDEIPAHYAENATGVLVQSVGGGGGNGGFSVASGAALSGSGSGAVTVGLGGKGAAGGTGGTVDVTSTGTISTKGDRSGGLVAQSVGGGGGNGGYNISVSGAGSGVGSGAVSVGLGGSAGAGNIAGAVTVHTLTGKITTGGADSIGVLAQSVGGGGGNGGYNVSVAASGAGGASGAVSVGLGGSGGTGANAGTVNLTVDNDVSTSGKNSAAVVAQAIGGGGGSGGYNVSSSGSGAGSGSGAISVGLGGSGGSAGDGADVTAVINGNIDTLLEKSSGILAQSVGGGGGNGGYNLSLSGSGGGISGAVSVGLGGSGAGGGNGTKVDLTSTGTILTKGADSTALVAQSIGGGGGNGGYNVSSAVSGGSVSGAVSVGLGGSGSGGGDGGIVIARTSGNITTEGDKSGGILAQSVGGGGGNGGFNVSTSSSIASTGSGAVSVGIGGSGAGGGNASSVTLTVNNDVTTKGKKSTGIIAQSIGGGGGNGGFDVTAPISGASSLSAAIGVGMGGSAGTGGNAGIVISNVTGTINTEQEGSGGLLAQSLGGGGGNGGMSIAGAMSFSGSGSGAVSVGLGGSGGAGGNSADVTNTFIGNVYTVGKDSFGVIAQSLGGGGGSGGMSISGAVSMAKTGSGALAFGLGGAGGQGGDAADVTNSVTGFVQTQGANSPGVLAQSMGGGGGNGGMNVSGVVTASQTGSGGLAIGIGGLGGDGGVGKTVINTVTGGVITTGNDSDAIVTQSLGGGGGNGGINVTGAINATKEGGGTMGVGIGGFGGNGGNAGNVTSTVTTTSTYNLIGTTGNNSSAVLAQSIGGGGGNGGMNVTGAVNLTGKSGAAIGVGLGGFGGGAGNSGTVTVDVTGQIITQGNESDGILAQSVGGGGGNGGMNVSGSLAVSQSAGSSSTAVSLGVGGFGGGGGDADAVDVTFNGMITARPGIFHAAVGGTPAYMEYVDGTGSNGLAAQSIGGGGGKGGLNVSGGISYAGGNGNGYGIVAGFGGFGGDGGNAGTSTVTVTGGQSITGYGAGKSAILAQSVGGGGGSGGMNVTGGITSNSGLLVGVGGFGGNAGTGDTVTVNATTNVFASTVDSLELNSAGIMAQSIGGGGGNGGMNVTGGLAISKQASVPSINLGIGGFGGAGASSGDVNVTLTGNATTSGDWVHGILAQSIAGGGGNGALNAGGQFNFADSNNSGGKTDVSIIAGVGGNAGAGADAGNVEVINNGIISTVGDYARGIEAQSIGGGGGTGGMNVTAIFAKSSNPITVGVGGSGGGGGMAGTVTVTRGAVGAPTGSITTDGIGAYGIEATSLGGGGGDAGMNFNVGYSSVGENGAKPGFGANFLIGGDGATASSGNTVTVTNYSKINTKQNSSYGILAQSIGGGGGNANFNMGITYENGSQSGALYNKPNQNMGFSLGVGGSTGNGGVGGDVTVTQVGDITTLGVDSYGVLAQSIGGGGGNAGMDSASASAGGGKVGITLGTSGGTGGKGGSVLLNYSGNLDTTGDGATGLLAQSLGNGGGNSSSTTVSGSAPSSQNDLGQTRSLNASVRIGLEGGTGGVGGMVTLNADGSITTRGKRAFGAMAQSVGGGGGNGGSANSYGITAAVTSFAMGGKGGTGGIGGTVVLTSSALVQTLGEESVGLFAQSIGGGGGQGGSIYGGGAKTGDTGVTVNIGGDGGVGTDGGDVTVTNDGIVVTKGLAAHAIVAQSIGGGGGAGGLVMSNTMKLNTASPNANSATRVSTNIGGTGGDGGDGKTVTVINHGGLGTYEDASVGILAQSIGGGGGNGRSVTTGSLAGSEGNSVSVSVGGSGGIGGMGGSVIVKNQKTSDPNSAMIITLGDQAHGILAMSIGGGGGTGSSVSTFNRGTLENGSTSAQQLGLSVGGNGGSGGTGGYVEVTNDGSIETYGAAAHGIIAESIGGGGGNGGMATSGQMAFGAMTSPAGGKTFQIAVGGQGGSANAGGDVVVNNSGTIHVHGDGSDGIYAQSIGGGGGNGGFAASFSRDLLTNPKTNFIGSVSNFAIGGQGGSGGDGGNVSVTNTGSITVEGKNAYGIYAQSVSGGGGNSAMSISSPVWMATNYILNSALGGTGSSGTTGTVTINSTGDITMLGSNSIAQFAQSVNGGGGNANQFLDFSEQAANLDANGDPLHGAGGAVDTAKGFVFSNLQLGADTVTNAGASLLNVIHKGKQRTQGDNSNGGLLQSIGGGGGRGTQDITMASGSQINLVLKLGGKDVSTSSGGTVNYTQTGDVSTTGNQSTGLGIQSIGGGGGTEFVTLQIVPDVSAFSLMSFAAFPAPPADNVTLGGDGGVLNDGGAINPTLTGAALTTSGDRSPALLLQSIGAGGGTAFVVGASALNVDIGGKNGASGDGKNIIGFQTRDVSTSGLLSSGIILQSIGGGGGLLLTNLDPSMIFVAPNSGNSGSGGVIDFTQNGNVFATGDRSTGVILQSLGGGGGIVDDIFAGSAGGVGSAGAVTFHMNGTIIATGAGGSGILAQSQGTAGQGNIQVDLATGKGIFFGTGGTGVHFSGGATNLFTNNGTVAGIEDVNGLAFLGEDGNDKVQNNGTFVGSANFGTGANQFNNASGALLAMGPEFLLGASGNQLFNDGILRPGGTGLAQHTDMTGSFTQSSTGTTFAELDFGSDLLDKVSMTGAAKLAGRIDVALLNPQLVPIGHFEKTLFHADGGVINEGAVLTTQPSVVITYGLGYPTGQDAVLSYDVNFNPPGSNFGRNLVEVGGYFNNIQRAGSSPALAPTIIALLYAPNLESYRNLLSQLGPDFYGEQQAEMLRGTQRFGETLLNGGSNRYSLKDRVIWFDFLGTNTVHSAYDDYKTVRQQTLGFALGFEDMINANWSVGLAVSFEDNSANGYQGRWNANGSTERFGGVLRYKNNGHELAAMISFGWNSMDSTRVGDVAYPFSTNVNRDMQVITAMVRYAHEFVTDDFYLKPQLDLGVTQLSAGAARENGGAATNLPNGATSGTNLALLGYNEAHAWVRPAVTVRKAIIVTNATRISLHTEMGYQYFINGNDTYVKAGFVGAPSGADGMNVPIGLGSMASLTVGMQVLIMNDLSIGLYYTKALSNHYHLDLYNFRVNKSF